MIEFENTLNTKDRDNKLLSDRVERIRSEREQIQAQLADKDIQLRSASEKADKALDLSNTSDANAWWAYVWHELKKQSQLGIHAPSGFAAATNVAHSDENLAILNAKYRENLRSQAIEIVQARQVRIDVAYLFITCLIDIWHHDSLSFWL